MRINFDFLYRKKRFADEASLHCSNLSRVLNLFDLTALGISCTLGSGVYVLIGNSIANYAGPSIIFSFMIAGVCSFLAGLCYAELGSRVPRSGSAYVYIYVTIGEFIAFIVGWDVVLEYVIGTSTAASALSKYIDFMADYRISKSLQAAMPMSSSLFAPYPDFLAFGLAVIITALLIVGVRESSFINILFTALNILVVLFIVIVGSSASDFSNWTLSTNANRTWTDTSGVNQTCASSNRCGSGGFIPFGLSGIIKATAKCFYAYIGFDCIATTGEEVIDPKRTIPLSIILTLLTVSLCYISVSATLTLMMPYFMLSADTPMVSAFDFAGMHWASYVVSVGAIVSLSTCLFASMFPMPRVVYAMSSDGLLFKFLSVVMPRFKTPLTASLLTGLLAGLLVLVFDLNQLIDMMSIGTLLAYSLVSACTLVLRYRPFVYETERERDLAESRSLVAYLFGESGDGQHLLKRLFAPASLVCTKASAHLVGAVTFLAVVDIFVLSIILNYGDFNQSAAFVFGIFFFIVLAVLATILWLQPQNREITTFKVPFVPFFPLASCFINIYLMVSMNHSTWIRFIVWFILGLLIYFSYGMRNSKENVRGQHQNYFFPCIEKSYAKMSEPPADEVTATSSAATTATTATTAAATPSDVGVDVNLHTTATSSVPQLATSSAQSRWPFVQSRSEESGGDAEKVMLDMLAADTSRTSESSV